MLEVYRRPHARVHAHRAGSLVQPSPSVPPSTIAAVRVDRP